MLIEIEQRHLAHPVSRTFDWLSDRGYEGFFWHHRELLPLSHFTVQNHQQEANRLGAPCEYVNNFLFVRHDDTMLMRRTGCFASLT
jgi:hypothetical protein